MFLKYCLYILISLSLLNTAFAQVSNIGHDAPQAGNPLLPGYFADPTVKKFGDTYYIYATTDGNGGGFGPAQVWTSRDFVNWSLQDMNWPTTHYYWAPDVTQTADGKYYMYYCQPVEIFGAWANSPTGPWTPLLPPGEPVVKNFLVPNVITLDGQTFRDDDGKMYMFWGTWGIYPDHGCGVGLLNPDMKTFAKTAKIPNTIAKDFFEAPFMFKRKGLYYLTYSSGRCEDDTYRVQYAVSKTGPMGPFVYGENNPILSTSSDGTIHGPGHQSVLQEGDDCYLIYHRHNNPHSGGGYHRQVAADQLQFDDQGNIEKLVPTHKGLGFLAKNANRSPDLLFGKDITVSSTYSADFKPENLVDHNNGTLWKPKDNTSPSWLSVDLGSIKKIASVHTQFEYATWYYQYLIEYSADGAKWEIFADRRSNTIHGSPMIDTAQVSARYLRLTITNTEYPGLNKAVWNIRAFADKRYHPKTLVKAKENQQTIASQGLLVDIDAAKLEVGSQVNTWFNAGKLGGKFIPEGDAVPLVQLIDGKNAVVFPGKSSFRSTFTAPASLSGNSSFTISMWVNNPVIEDEEPLLSWTTRGGVDMSNATIGYGSSKKWGAAAHWGWADMAYRKLPAAGSWHHIALVFDGTNEKLYVDGVLDKIELKMLFLANLKQFILGSNDDKNAYFSGALASLQVYDTPKTASEITVMASAQNHSDVVVSLDAAGLKYGPMPLWKNNGFSKGNWLTANGINAIPEVVDRAGKIAVLLDDKTPINLGGLLPDTVRNEYSIVTVLQTSLLGKGWHQVVDVYKNGSRQSYLDGQLKKLPLFFSAGKIPSIGGSGKPFGIASITIFDHSIDALVVEKLYQSWQKTLVVHNVKVNQEVKGSQEVKAQFKLNPRALSTEIVTMEAQAVVLPGTSLEYYFAEKGGAPGGDSSGWINQTSYNDFGLTPGRRYTYTVKVRDNFGNVSKASQPIEVDNSLNRFTIISETFDSDRNFLKDSLNISSAVKEISWDGMMGNADTLANRDGKLMLSSTDTKWDGGNPMGPFLYKNITGDFVAQVEVKDVSGLKNKKANGANDVGLMVRTQGSYNLVQNSIFPGWGVGNMVTSLGQNGRLQNNNASAWNFYTHLQIQRRASVFYLRGSVDGLNWQDLPGSPLNRPDLGNTLQVGLFQATYGKQSGYGLFDNFIIIQPKH